MNLPIGKDYFTNKIKKTVKNYFQIRRTSMGNNFNLVELLRENRKSGGVKTEMKNHKVKLEIDSSWAKTDSRRWAKDISSNDLNKAADIEVKDNKTIIEKQSFVTEKNPEERINQAFERAEFKSEKFQKGLAMIRENPRKQKRRVTGRSGCFVKVDMGLQTEEFESRESRTRKQQTKFSMYETRDDVSEC
jgi:hypothetical protein